MKIANSIPKKTAAEKQGFKSAPISIERPEPKELKDGAYSQYDLRIDPKDKKSLTRRVKQPHFTDGTPEEWFLFLIGLKDVIAGQDLATGPQQYALTRNLLKGQVLAAFNAKASELKTENNDNFEKCLHAVTAYVLPKRAVQLQKRYMRRICRKPPTMTMKAYVARFRELNEYLALFDEKGEKNKIPDDELMENCEFGIPAKWRKEMILQGFEPVEHTVQDFVDFCERLEATEEINEALSKKADKHGKSNDENPSKRKRGGPRAGTDGKAKYDCLYHGANNTHATHDCLILKDQAKKMAAAHSNVGGRFKKARFENKTWRRSDGDSDGEKKKKTGELHAYIKSMVDNAVKQSAKKRKAEDPPSMDNFNYDMDDLNDLPDFDKLSVSSDSDVEMD